jgi:hypothetical protein
LTPRSAEGNHQNVTNPGFFTILIALASVAAIRVSAQSVKPGAFTRVEGSVYLDDQRVPPSVGELPKITENSLVRTEDGRADVLLSPGATLRLGEKSSFRMIANRPSDTRIELLTGSAVTLTDENARDTNPFERRPAGRVTVVCEDTVTLSNFGAYRFDNFQPPRHAELNFCRFRVYRGIATVQLLTVTAVVVSGEMMVLNRPCGDHVQVNQFDIGELSQPLALTPALDIKGQVRAEGQGEVHFEGMRVALLGFPRRGTNPKQDGRFALEKVFADGYTVGVSGLPEGYYVKSIRLGDIAVLESGLDLTRGASGPLDILISPNGGQFDGFVTDAKQQPARGAKVVLVPEARYRRQLHSFKNATADQHGHFAIKGITPGEYKVFAWEWIEPDTGGRDSEFLYVEPGFVKQYENEGQEVAIREGRRESAQLKLIPYLRRTR